MKTWRVGLIALSIIFALAVMYFLWLSLIVNRPVVINQTAVPPLPALNPDQVAQGEALYAIQCAQCHGAHLKGSPTWKEPLPDGSLPPPPHESSGHTWHHSDKQLINIIANGGDPAYNSKMPAFKAKLTPNEIIAILEFIKSKWGREEREFQWWITMRPNGE